MAAEQQKEVNEFDIMRQRITERQREAEKTGKKAVQQNFASRGLLQSGAQVKAQQQERQAAAVQAQEERRDVLVAEAGVRRQEREAERQRQFVGQQATEQRQFQTSERLGTQQFAGQQAGEQRRFVADQATLDRNLQTEQARLGRELTQSESLAQRKFLEQEALLGRELTISERIAQNAFAASEAAENRTFTTEERVAAQNFVEGESELQRDFQRELQQIESDLKKELQTTQLTSEEARFSADLAYKKIIQKTQEEQFDREFTESVKNQSINAMNALKANGYSDFEIQNLFQALGIPNAVQGLTTQAGVNTQNISFPGISGLGF